ncbi:MAG: ATP-dependent DNA helicase RecG [bacterium]|nr:ATP-dependent DNA helicase RecG [bacterium]
MNLSSPLTSIPRVGEAYEKRLQKLGITTVRDLLFHFPNEYKDLSLTTPIKKLKEGEGICIRGTILEISEVRTFAKRMHLTEALVSDATGSIRVVWFNQPYLPSTLHKEDEVFLAGKLMRDKSGVFLNSPLYEKVSDEQIHTGRIVPFYAETKGVSSKWLRSAIRPLLSQLSLEDKLPEEIIKDKGLPSFRDAISQIHFPDSTDQVKRAQRRFSFEELFLISLFVLSERKRLAKIKAVQIPFSELAMKRLVASLPYQLTDDQRKAAFRILKDMEKPRPMNRILQGEVGSGKTIVAAMAALAVVKARHQAALLAPTEILAKQHFGTLGRQLAEMKATVGLLTGSTDLFLSPKLPRQAVEVSRKKLLTMAKEGKLDVLLGTHAVIQDKVKFADLALVIVDEQHRFGVKQRAKLLSKSDLIPHLLTMTATPIPRTLALTIYGDLDISTLKELPKGRKKTKTSIVPPEERKETYEFIKGELTKGNQAFIICPRIEESEDEGIKTVEQEYKLLSEEVFPDFRVAKLHGKLASKEKERTMSQMARGKIDVLVSTSVVEVGVDIARATCMVIEGADRFGLAQLHQFRGRVGRSDIQSYCFLFTESGNEKTKKRLEAVVSSEDGFQLAEQDLLLRGPGDFAGVKQWGIPDFAMKQLTNLKLVQEAREAAEELLTRDISLVRHPLLKSEMERFKENLHLE